MRIITQDMCIKMFCGIIPDNFTVEQSGGKYAVAMHDVDGVEILARYHSKEKAKCICAAVKNFCADPSKAFSSRRFDIEKARHFRRACNFSY